MEIDWVMQLNKSNTKLCASIILEPIKVDGLVLVQSSSPTELRQTKSNGLYLIVFSELILLIQGQSMNWVQLS